MAKNNSISNFYFFLEKNMKKEINDDYNMMFLLTVPINK